MIDGCLRPTKKFFFFFGNLIFLACEDLFFSFSVDKVGT